MLYAEESGTGGGERETRGGMRRRRVNNGAREESASSSARSGRRSWDKECGRAGVERRRGMEKLERSREAKMVLGRFVLYLGGPSLGWGGLGLGDWEAGGGGGGSGGACWCWCWAWCWASLRVCWVGRIPDLSPAPYPCRIHNPSLHHHDCCTLYMSSASAEVQPASSCCDLHCVPDAYLYRRWLAHQPAATSYSAAA